MFGCFSRLTACWAEYRHPSRAVMNVWYLVPWTDSTETDVGGQVAKCSSLKSYVDIKTVSYSNNRLKN